MTTLTLEQIKEKVICDVRETCGQDTRYLWDVVESYVNTWTEADIREYYKNAFDVFKDENEE